MNREALRLRAEAEITEKTMKTAAQYAK